MKQLKNQLITGTLLCLGLLAWLPAAAQGGNSIPYFEIDSIHIPRIDVEGYGSLNITLKLEDDVALTFSVSEAVDADPNLTPGATFDLTTTLLDIPLVKVDNDYYDVELVLIPGDLFQLTVAEFADLPGQEDYNNQCASCHGLDGTGGAVAVSLVNCANCSGLDALSTYINNVMPLATPGSCVDSCASDVADYILTVFSSSTSSATLQALEAIQELPLQDTLRKASLQLVGRLPTASEEALVSSGGEDGLRQVLDGMMDEEAFYDRLSEIFNDFLHTNRYLAANGPFEQAINLMPRFLPDKRWFDPGVDYRDDDYQFNRITTNDSVAAEPLQLINYVVKNDLPLTEILTADYFMVNPYSAKSWGLFDSLSFQDEWDPDEWLPAQLTLPVLPSPYNEPPQSGLLTSLMFLNRYPTSETNRNRGRSRVVYDLFLDVDILALDGERPDGEAVDITSPAPTMDNDDCVICHSLLDPVASSFENWDRRGLYLPFEPWYDDMFQAGFAGVDRPDSEEPTSLQWLAGQMAVDPRFNDAMLRIVYQGLTGTEPLSSPTEFSTDAEIQGYEAEALTLDELKTSFANGGQNLKTLVSEIVLSPYYRADSLDSDSFALVHAETGAARLLTPELLHRKIEAVLGFEWRSILDNYSVDVENPFFAKLLDNRIFYNQIYGGIDSFTVTERLTEPNGLMVYVQERMANELACFAVPNDFIYPAQDRLLFPHVETSTQPTNSISTNAIMSNIQHLHSHLLGTDLAVTDPEVTATFELFSAVLASGQGAIGVTEADTLPFLCRRTKDMYTGEDLDTEIVDDPNYVIRAWMAVVAYLMADYEFLYE